MYTEYESLLMLFLIIFFKKAIFHLNFVGAESHIFTLRVSQCQTYAKQLDQKNSWTRFFSLSGVVTCQPGFTVLVLLSPLSNEGSCCNYIIPEVQHLTRKGDHSEEVGGQLRKKLPKPQTISGLG